VIIGHLPLLAFIKEKENEREDEDVRPVDHVDYSDSPGTIHMRVALCEVLWINASISD
jgi:hypothetical protein